MQRLKVVELFGGIGAPKLALKNVLGDRFNIIDYVEINPQAVQAYCEIHWDYKHNKPRDVADFSFLDRGERTDILFHGSPCQGFSSAGNDLARSTEPLDMVRKLILATPRALLPTIIIWENVVGAINKNNKVEFDAYVADLDARGYMTKWAVLNGVDFGIPQKRRRVFAYSSLNRTIGDNFFSFERLEKTPTRPLIEFLETEISDEFYVRQPSMLKAVKQGKVKIITGDAIQVITTKMVRWNNCGVLAVPVKEPKIKKDGTTILPIKCFNNDDYVSVADKSGVVIHTLRAMGKPPILALPAVELKKDVPVWLLGDKAYMLRYITPREAFRLMGFRDEHYDRLTNKSKNLNYKLAGNSIIVPVLESIIKELIRIEYPSLLV